MHRGTGVHPEESGNPCAQAGNSGILLSAGGRKWPRNGGNLPDYPAHRVSLPLGKRASHSGGLVLPVGWSG